MRYTQAETKIEHVLNNDSSSATREERFAEATLCALRGIMGELSTIRELMEIKFLPNDIIHKEEQTE